MSKPPITPSLTRIATIRFHPEEYASLVSEANLRGISLSDLIRRAVLGIEFPAQRIPRVDARMVSEMSRIGSNLNQSVHAFNRWEFTEVVERKDLWQRWKVGLRELAATLKILETRLLQ